MRHRIHTRPYLAPHWALRTMPITHYNRRRKDAERFGEKPFLIYTSWLLNRRFGARQRRDRFILAILYLGASSHDRLSPASLDPPCVVPLRGFMERCISSSTHGTQSSTTPWNIIAKPYFGATSYFGLTSTTMATCHGRSYRRSYATLRKA
jgi:hypothetical protein